MSTSPAPAPAAAPATSQNTVTVAFAKEKETKNCVKFEEVERPGLPKVIGSLYVQKHAAGSSGNLTVTIRFQQ